MIYIIGTAPLSSQYTQLAFDDFKKWALMLSEYELDIETTMTAFWCDKELVTIQIGYGGVQCVIRWNELTPEQQAWMKAFLEDPTMLKIIHNAQFEYIVLRFHGIQISNIYDTMLAEQVIRGGEVAETKDGFYSLLAVLWKYLEIDLDKTEQTTFNLEGITEEQVVYAATDVMHMTSVKELQEPIITAAGLDKVFKLESDALYGYADMTYNGMGMNSAAWLANLDLVEPIIEKAGQDLEAAVYEDVRLYQKAVELGYICETDQLIINWNSANQKKELLRYVYADLELFTKAYIVKHLKTNTYGDVYDWVLNQMMDKNYAPFEEVLTVYFRQRLIDAGYLIPAGVLTINWNSRDQVLPLLQAVEPKLQSLSADDVDKCSHFILPYLTDYKDSLKLKTTYGEAFLEKHLEPDGQIRTSYNQVVSTGRCSSRRPNLQNIPAKETVGNRYRNAFICPPGWVFVDSDYESQELVVLTWMSKDPVFEDALKTGKDLHSVCAELVFKDIWKDAASPGCEFYESYTNKAGVTFPQNSKHKCSCKGHKRLRTNVKTLNFGLVYGMSKYKLAASLKISVKEADDLMVEYFETFPKIKALLNFLAKFGREKGYIQTIFPYFRKRYFEEWKLITKAEHNFHANGVKRSPALGRIERQSMNMPIQGCSGDITKRALVLIREYINDNKLQDSIKIVAHVHDQITTICLVELSEAWKAQLTLLMEAAAKESIPSGLLKADTNITLVWQK
jgi:DNA polymerase I-like protein with 3'-5' exonuclease and polymerase domains